MKNWQKWLPSYFKYDLVMSNQFQESRFEEAIFFGKFPFDACDKRQMYLCRESPLKQWLGKADFEVNAVE